MRNHIDSCMIVYVIVQAEKIRSHRGTSLDANLSANYENPIYMQLMTGHFEISSSELVELNQRNEFHSITRTRKI